MHNPSLKGFGVAITRPVDQAKKLGFLIEQSGGQAISFPLISITGLEDYAAFNTSIAALETVDWLIFISSNAVQNAMPRIQSLYPILPERCQFAAIGPVTANELQTYGIKKVLIPVERFDSEALLALPEMHEMRDKNVLIVRGIGGREVLAETLIGRGATVNFAECYQRNNPQTDCNFLVNLWQQKACHAIVVTSSEAMQHLMNMAQTEENWRNVEYHWLRHIKICVNHARIAEHASLKGFQIHIAQTAGDAAMLDCLIKALIPS